MTATTATTATTTGPARRPADADPATPAAVLGPSGGYAERAPTTAPRDVVACLWSAALPRWLPPLRIVPDGCVDLITDGHLLWVAGPDTGAVVERRAPETTLVGLRLRPGTADRVLGVPAAAVRDQRLPLEALWGAAAEPLAERLHHLVTGGDVRAASGVLEAAVSGRLAGAPPPDRAVAAVVAHLAAGGPGAVPSVSALADAVGLSERQLLRRCTAAVGYGPTVLGRVLRFQRFLAAAGEGPARRLADLAADAGYADQAHLAHETARLAGLPPSALLPTARVDVRSGQDSGARRRAGLTP